MTIKSQLLAAGAALLLTAGAAIAMPATAQTDLNVRSGPGTQYPVVGSIQGGETVDVGSCTGAWCQVSFGGGMGFANRSYLALGGGAGLGPAIAVAPYVYGDDDDYGYAPGPAYGVYGAPRYRQRQQGWNGQNVNGGNWTGRGGRGSAATPGYVAPRAGFAGPPAGWQRPGTGIGAGGGAGFRAGGAGFRAPAAAPAARAAAPAAPAAQGGFAGSIVK